MMSGQASQASEQESNRTWDEILRAVWTVATHRPGLLVVVVGLSVVVALLEGIGLGFILPIVELARGKEVSGVARLFARVYRAVGLPLTLEWAVAGVGAVMLVRYGLSFVVGWMKATMQASFTRDLQQEAFSAALAARVSYFDDEGSDEILNTVLTESGYAGNFIGNGLKLAELSLLILMYVSLALLIAPVLTVVTLSLLGGALYVIRGVLESGYTVGERVAAANRRLQSAAQAGMQGIRDVKLFRLEPELEGRFSDAAAQQADASVEIQRNQVALDSAYQFLSAMTVFGLLYFGLVLFNIELSQLAVFLFAMFRLAPKASSATNVLYRAEGDLPHVIRTQSFISTLQERTEPSGGTMALPDSIQSIRFEDVGFAYGDRCVLDDVSLSVRAGEFVALVGPSGAGKSTIAALLARLYEPDRGRIYADEVPINELSLDDWRERIAVVRQQPWVFNETLRYNLTIGNREADDSDLQRVCDAAKVSEFVHQLPDGYETVLGDDGVRLSGGQRQRVAVARALLTDADVLILDEATSDLDSSLEAKVHEAIEQANEARAIIAIAHRLSTVVDADRIYTIDDGEVVESGVHDELLNNDGEYARLYATQVQ